MSGVGDRADGGGVARFTDSKFFSWFCHPGPAPLPGGWGAWGRALLACLVAGWPACAGSFFLPALLLAGCCCRLAVVVVLLSCFVGGAGWVAG